MKKILFAAGTFCALSGFSQTVVNNVWLEYSGNPAYYHWTDHSIDDQSDVYRIGNIQNGSNVNIELKKLDEGGNLLWTQQYESQTGYEDYGARAKWYNGYLYMASITRQNSSSDFDIFLQRVNSSGTTDWSQTLSPSSTEDDIVVGFEVNADGIFITGYTSNAGQGKDMYTAMINHTGQLQWSDSYDYSGGDDAAVSVNIKNGIVQVFGGASSTLTTGGYQLLNYDLQGTLLEDEFIQGSVVGIDKPIAARSDNNNNIYLTGNSLTQNGTNDVKVVKLDNQLNTLWSYTYDNAGMDDKIADMHLNDLGEVYLTGSTKNANNNTEYLVIGMTSQGTLNWDIKYDVRDESQNYNAYAIAPLNNNELIIAGKVSGTNNLLSVWGVSTAGELEWYKTYEEQGVAFFPTRLTVEGEDIIVSGKATTSQGGEFFTNRYQTKQRISQVDNIHTNIVNGEILIRFDTVLLDTDFVDNKGMTFTPLKSLLDPVFYTQLKSHFEEFMDLDQVTAYKVFPNEKSRRSLLYLQTRLFGKKACTMGNLLY